MRGAERAVRGLNGTQVWGKQVFGANSNDLMEIPQMTYLYLMELPQWSSLNGATSIGAPSNDFASRLILTKKPILAYYFKLCRFEWQ